MRRRTISASAGSAVSRAGSASKPVSLLGVAVSRSAKPIAGHSSTVGVTRALPLARAPVYCLCAMAARVPRPVLVLHGPNLNLLGRRGPAVYGRVPLAQVNRAVERHAMARGTSAVCRQSNHEGQLV